MRLTFLLPLFTVSLLTACSAPTSTDEGTEAASAHLGSANAKPTGQTFPKLSTDMTNQVVQTFVQNNGAAWTARPTVDDYLPFLRHFESTDAVGSGPTVTLAEAQASAVDFINRNAAVLGVSAEEIGRLSFFTTTDSHQLFDRQDAPFYLGYVADTPRPGYESFPTVSTHTVIWIAVLADGRVVGVDQLYTERLPELTFSTTPVLPPSDATLTHDIIGLPFVYSRIIFGKCFGARNLGPIAASDIGASPTLTINVSRGPELAVDLGYSFIVTKGDGSGRATLLYTVDTADGRIVAAPPPPCTPDGD